MEGPVGDRAAWEAMAASFDATRRRPWPAVVDFLQGLPKRALVFDAGTGNGRHAHAAASLDLRTVAFDFSRSLLLRAQGRHRGPAWIEADVEAPPLRPTRFDAGLAVACLHHVRGRARRMNALRRLMEPLRPKGLLLVSVWSRHQPALENPRKPLRPPAVAAEPGDAMLRWTQHGLDVERFVHLYDFEEFEQDVAGVNANGKVWRSREGAGGGSENFWARLEA